MGFVRVKVLNAATPLSGATLLDNRVRRDISQHQMGIVRAIAHSNPFVGPGINVLAHSLLCGGIRVRKGKGTGDEQELDPVIHDLLQNEWAPFAKELLRHQITYGFCIVAIDVERKCPYVRDPLDSFSRICISSDEHGLDRMYELTMRESHKYNGSSGSSAFISLGAASPSVNSPERSAPPMFVVEHNPPGVDGDLTSTLRTIVAFDAFLQTIMSCQVSACLRNAMPVMITSTEHNDAESKARGRDMGAAGDAAIMIRGRDQVNHNMHFNATRENADRLQALNQSLSDNYMDANRARVEQMGAGGQNWASAMHTAPGGSSAMVNNAPLVLNPVTGSAEWPGMVGARQFEGAMIPLAPNTKLETTPIAQGAEAFIVKMWEVFRDVTLMNLGVPPVLWGSTSSSVAGNLVVVNTYNDTKHNYRVLLQSVLKFVFIKLFGAHEILAEAQAKARKAYLAQAIKKRVNEAVSEDTTHDNISSRIDVCLVGTLDLEQINAINTMGLLPFKTLRKLTAGYLGIPEDDLATEPMDPATGRPMKEVQNEQMEREDQVMHTQAKLQMSVKAPGKSGVGKQPAQKKPKTTKSAAR